MITDNIKNKERYYLNQKFKAAFEFIASAENLPIGRYEVCDGVYSVVQEYETKPSEDCKIETHNNYIDVQYIAEGKEAIGFAKTENCVLTEKYDENKDIAFYSGNAEKLSYGNGDFAVFFVGEAHMPQIGDGKRVRKILVKIRNT